MIYLFNKDFAKQFGRQVQNQKVDAHPWSDKEVYNYIIKNRHKVRSKANKNVGLAASKQPRSAASGNGSGNETETSQASQIQARNRRIKGNPEVPKEH